MIFVLVYFRALQRKPVICKSNNAFRFSRFLVTFRERNHRKSSYCHGKYFAKENFRAPAWILAKCCWENKTGNSERAVSLHLARSVANHSAGFASSCPLGELAMYDKATFKSYKVVSEVKASLNWQEKRSEVREKSIKGKDLRSSL